jgi:ectoine hydroxylase-related dioxygenase (phytanoyl-CoA dioxygenase family)
VREFNYPIFTLGNTLTQEQIEIFEEHGFLHFRNFINPDAVAQIIRAMNEIQAKWIANNVEKVNGVPIKYGFDADGSKIVQRFAFASQHNPVLHEFLQDERFKALFPLLKTPVGARVGENEKDGLVINHYINTDKSEFTQMGWHTDAPRDIFLGKKIGPMLNVGLHIDACPPTKGGLRLIPGTHKQGFFGLFFRKKYFVDNNPDPLEIALNSQPGDLTVHDGRLWHRVAQAEIKGEESRRRVMYIPIIDGEYNPKNENSPTPFYQKFMKSFK